MLLVSTIVLILLISIILLWFSERKIRQRLAMFPGPEPLPFIGNAHLFKSISDIYPMSLIFRKRYGALYKIQLGPQPRIIICEPKSAEFLLSSQIFIEKSYEYKFLHAWLGTGLLTSTDSKWKSRRKLLTPTFHFKILEKYVSIFNNQSNTLVENLKPKLDGEPFDIFPLITLCALDIICEAAMGTKIDAQKVSTSPYVLSVKDMCRIVIDRTFSPTKMFNCIYKFTSTYKHQEKCLSILHGFTNSVIQSRKKNFTKIKLNNSDEEGVTKRVAFLDLLLQCNADGALLSDEDIREEVDTFMFEGHDTTATAISFTLYALSQHTNVQRKIFEELQGIFGDDHDRLPTYTDLQGMKYLELAIKESLRLYPPVPTFSRILSQDAKFEDKIFPKGVTLTVYSLLLHRNPDVFPNPDKFDPDRFLPENSASRSPYAYVPFSAGSRNCIGQRFAMLELKSTVSKVLRHYELVPVLDHEPELGIEAILKSYNGLPIVLKKRSYN